MSAVENIGRVLVNKRELAKRILKCSLPTLTDLIDRYEDFPIEQRGANGIEYMFDAELVVEFLRGKREEETRLTAEAAAERAEYFKQFSLPIDDIAPEEARGLTPTQRQALAKARLIERKLALESSLLVSMAELRQDLTIPMQMLGKFLDTLPTQVGADLNLPEEAQRAMRSRIDEARRAFVREVERRMQSKDADGE